MTITNKIVMTLEVVCLCAIVMPNPIQAKALNTSQCYGYEDYTNCSGNAVYWFDSCDNRLELYQQCGANEACENAECVDVGCGSSGDDYTDCSGNAVYWFDDCDNRLELYQQCASNQTCQNAQCVNLNITCSTNSQCGTSGIVGNAFCQSGNVYKNYKTYTCNNPGTASSSCANTTTAQLQTTCSGNQTCSNGSCINQNIVCSANSQCGTSGPTGSLFCQGNNIYQNYINYTCNNPGTSYSSCSSATTPQINSTCSGNQTCSNGSCTNTNYCSSNYQQRCSGNNLYWYDSCGNQQSLSQYCTNGCSGNACENYNYNYNNNYNTYGNCTYHAYKLCVGNSSYWYNSCGAQQDLYTNCYGGQTCQYGQCATYIINPVLPPVQPINNYIAYYRTSCSGNSVYWFDSLGANAGLYKNCNDSNSCTTDSCSASSCINTLKCDGTTCATGSADYASYCATNIKPACGNGLCEPNLAETNASCPIDCKINTTINNLSVSFFTKQDATSTQWQKAIQVGPNSQVYFMATATNNSTTPVDNVFVSANIPGEIFSLGNLKVDGVPISGDIVSGVNIGSLPAGATKPISFEGKTQSTLTSSTEQGTITSNTAGTLQSDSVSINFNSNQAVAAVSGASTSSGFWDFLKKWYLWIIIAIALIFLFIIVFKRFSSEV